MGEDDHEIDLTDEERKWVKEKFSDEKARGRLAVSLRNWLSLIMLIGVAFITAIEQFRTAVLNAIK